MVSPPDIDGRRRAQLRAHLASIAPYYTDDWNADGDDPGSTVLTIYAEFVEEIVSRLDRVPEKQFVAFLDSLGFSRRPPQAARVPLVLSVDEDAGRNVTIPAGTHATGESDDDGSEVLYEIGATDGFEATPAGLRHIYSVDPMTDAVFDHRDALAHGTGSRLFDGENRQEHALYIGDGDLLNLGDGAGIHVSLETDFPPEVLRTCFEWEFYGEVEIDGEVQVGWHRLNPLDGDDAGPCRWATNSAIDTFLEAHEKWFKSHGWELSDTSPDVRRRILARIVTDLTTSDHTVPPDLFASGPDQAALRRALGGGGDAPDLGALRAEIDTIMDRAAGQRRRRGPRRVKLGFEFPGPTTDHTVAEAESRWIRARLPTAVPSSTLFDVEIRDLTLDAGTGTRGPGGSVRPDAMLTNDVPIVIDGDVHPFGREPHPRTAFYIACEEAFTKRGATVTVQFEPPEERTRRSADVEISWEYWNGSGWAGLSLANDWTAGLTRPGGVSFEVPGDLTPTTVSGHDGYWIRVRLVGGDYGRVRYEERGEGTWEWDASDVTPPRFGELQLHYEQADAPTHLVCENNRSFTEPTPEARREGFRPFEALPDADQAVYFGFDGRLHGGPITLYVAVEDAGYPVAFDPRVRWEYCEDPDADTWTRLNVSDETRSFRESGIVRLGFPDETRAFARFGETRHWIRARITRDAFTTPRATILQPIADPNKQTADGPEPHRPAVRTGPAGGPQTKHPPRLGELHLNAAWAYNRRTITEEVLGSSDGSSTQPFELEYAPVTDDPVDVWVDERSDLAEDRRRELRATRPDDVETETGPDDAVTAFWVRWEEVPNFLGSGDDDRHYVLDRATGRLRFGDGRNGRIPPSGRDNLRADYRSGGGRAGNVAANTITDLRRSLPLVDAVRNPITAVGGTDQESMDDVRANAPRKLQDRGRSVLPEDFERIALDATGELSRATCIAGVGKDGRREPGWVTVIIVPDTRERRPSPSAELRRHVSQTLERRAPASVVDAHDPRLIVRGPSYIEVEVTATLEATVGERLSALESTGVEAITKFCHPVSGGPDGTGWDFGTLPHVSDLYALLEGLEGVDHVVDLAVTFTGEEDRVTVGEGEPSPRVAPDTLVSSGRHRITVTGGL